MPNNEVTSEQWSGAFRRLSAAALGSWATSNAAAVQTAGALVDQLKTKDFATSDFNNIIDGLAGMIATRPLDSRQAIGWALSLVEQQAAYLASHEL